MNNYAGDYNGKGPRDKSNDGWYIFFGIILLLLLFRSFPAGGEPSTPRYYEDRQQCWDAPWGSHDC